MSPYPTNARYGSSWRVGHQWGAQSADLFPKSDSAMCLTFWQCIRLTVRLVLMHYFVAGVRWILNNERPALLGRREGERDGTCVWREYTFSKSVEATNH